MGVSPGAVNRLTATALWRGVDTEDVEHHSDPETISQTFVGTEFVGGSDVPEQLDERGTSQTP